MNIHQLSVTYLPEQDRILARVNTTAGEEMRLWLTRRLMVGLWPLLSKAMTERLLRLETAGSSLDAADDQLKQMLTDFRKEEFLQHADFATPYRENEPNLPLGEEPLLVTDVDATPLPNGRLRLCFNESARLRAAPLAAAASPESPQTSQTSQVPQQALADAALAQPPDPAAARRFQMEMEPRLMQGLLHLLEQALVQSRWRETFLQGELDNASVTEDAAKASRPRYLN